MPLKTCGVVFAVRVGLNRVTDFSTGCPTVSFGSIVVPVCDNLPCADGTQTMLFARRVCLTACFVVVPGVTPAFPCNFQAVSIEECAQASGGCRNSQLRSSSQTIVENIAFLSAVCLRGARLPCVVCVTPLRLQVNRTVEKVKTIYDCKFTAQMREELGSGTCSVMLLCC